MKLSVVNKNYGIHIWWNNFIDSLVCDSGTDNQINASEFNKLILSELAIYGGSMKLPYMEIEFDDEAKATWFILRWS